MVCHTERNGVQQEASCHRKKSANILLTKPGFMRRGCKQTLPHRSLSWWNTFLTAPSSCRHEHFAPLTEKKMFASHSRFGVKTSKRLSPHFHAHGTQMEADGNLHNQHRFEFFLLLLFLFLHFCFLLVTNKRKEQT